LDGNVFDRLSRNAIAATVDLLNVAGTPVAARAMTDPSGRFSFGAVSAGNYVIRASASGYDSSTQTINLTANTIVDIGLSRADVVALMIADSGNGANTFCTPNATTAPNVSIVNSSSYSVDVAFIGGYRGDPATQGCGVQIHFGALQHTSVLGNPWQLRVVRAIVGWESGARKSRVGVVARV
jgi:hypothetical protein